MVLDFTSGLGSWNGILKSFQRHLKECLVIFSKISNWIFSFLRFG